MTGKLQIVPLGGLGEIGQNMTAIEYGRNVIVIDAGIMFPESDLLGVDYILPNWDYLRDKKDRLRAVLITHGHLDHMGAIAHFLEEFDVPVYATRLTRGMIELRLQERGLLKEADLHTYAAGDRLTIGPFTIEPYHVAHSIPDSVGLGITTPAGMIVHSGDFKLDQTPVDGQPTDLDKLAEFSQRGVLALLSDSTGADRPGSTPSEAVLYDVFHRLMRQAQGRLIIATFGSLISRIQQVATVAEREGRRLAIAGRSMVQNTEMARELGYLEIPDHVLVDVDQVKHLPPNQVVILATGSQGEPMAVLNRLATGKHNTLHIQEGDTVVLSSHIIPGNEETTHGVINRLFQRGADVFYAPLTEAHVSGHASQDELKRLIEIVKPRYFMPVHGELRHLVQHAKLAHGLGMAKKDIAVVENGCPVTIDERGIHVGKRIPCEPVYVAGALVGEMGADVTRQRDGLANGGFVTAIAHYDRAAGKTVGQPRIITHGLVLQPQAPDLMARAQDVVRGAASNGRGTPATRLEAQVEKALASFFYRETRLKPVVTAALMEV